MENDSLLPASRKKPPPGKAIVVALLGLHGLLLIIIGLIAFFGGSLGSMTSRMVTLRQGLWSLFW